jgi:membrane associated rhomboid family serine protease
MQIDVPDPDYTGSAQTRVHFRLAVRIAFGFVGVLCVTYLMTTGLDQDPEPFGIHPRQLAGLPGIIFAPLVHSDFAHLISNAGPLLVLGTAMLFLYPLSALRVLPAVYFGSGIAVWLFARDSVHFGASGLVYGLASYIFVAGVFRRDRRAVATSLVVCFLYGSLVWGVLPLRFGVSWETHLAATLIGVVLAFALRRLDVPPRKRYAWEGGTDDDEGDAEDPPLQPAPEDPDRPAA